MRTRSARRCETSRPWPGFCQVQSMNSTPCRPLEPVDAQRSLTSSGCTLTWAKYDACRFSDRELLMSIHEISREFHHSRYKVREVLQGDGEPQKYGRRATQSFPKLALVLDRIREILKVDESEPPKQRHTAMRLFERLRDEHGYKGGYDTVRRFVQQHRGKQRETFIPWTMLMVSGWKRISARSMWTFRKAANRFRCSFWCGPVRTHGLRSRCQRNVLNRFWKACSRRFNSLAAFLAKCGGRIRRLWLKRLDPLHYMITLTRRPGALDHSNVYRDWQLPECFAELRSRLEQRHGVRSGVRHFVRVLQLLGHHSVPQVATVIEQLRDSGAADADHIIRRVESSSTRPQNSHQADLHGLVRSDMLLLKSNLRQLRLPTIGRECLPAGSARNWENSSRNFPCRRCVSPGVSTGPSTACRAGSDAFESRPAWRQTACSAIAGTHAATGRQAGPTELSRSNHLKQSAQNASVIDHHCQCLVQHLTSPTTV